MRQFGPYRLRSELSRGGMGIVYRAVRESPPHREVALKVLAAREVPDTTRARFRREAEALARIRHPGVVRVHEVGEHAGDPFLALELIEGRTLREQVAAEGPLSAARATRVGRALAEAVGAIHAEGILHRDLKPSNVILDAEDAPRVIDFGIVYEPASTATRLTLTGALVGTPEFLAPEQAQGQRELLGPSTDVFGIGGVLYFALSGQAPYVGDSLPNLLFAAEHGRITPLRELRPELPRALVEVVMRALALAPKRRYPSCAALAQALERAGEGGPALGTRAVVGAGLALVAASGLALVSIRGDPSPEVRTAPPPAAPTPQVALAPPADAQPEPADPWPPDPPPGVDAALDAERCEALLAALERAEGPAARERVATRLLAYAEAAFGQGISLMEPEQFAIQERVFRAVLRGVVARARLRHARGDSLGARADLELIPMLGGLPTEVLSLQIEVLVALGDRAGAHARARDYLGRLEAREGTDLRTLQQATAVMLWAQDLELVGPRRLVHLVAAPDPDMRRLAAWAQRLREAPPEDPGVLALARQDPDAAGASFAARRSSDPELAHLGLAAVARERHAWEVVLAEVAQVLELAPERAEAWALRAEACFALGRQAEGARAASTALAAGGDPRAWVVPCAPRQVRALACRDSARWPQAAADAYHLRTVDPRLAPWAEAAILAPLRARARALRDRRELEQPEVRERLELQLALPELELPWRDDLERLAAYGVDARRRGLDLFTGFLQLEALGEVLGDPSSTQPERASALFFLGRHEEAWTAWEVERRRLAAEGDARECDALFGQARVDVLLGLRPEHVEQVQRAIDRAVRFPAAVAYKGELLRRLGRYAEAVAACEAALDRKPDLCAATSGVFPLLDRALALEALGRTAEAARDAERLLNLGEVRQQEGRELLRRLRR